MTPTLRLVTVLSAAALLSSCGMIRPPVSNPGPAPAAAPAAPAPLSGTPTDRLVAALEENGCVLTAGNRDVVLARAGLGLPDLATIIPELNAAGRAEAADEGSIRILSDNCI
jgi:hypothetical protein